MSWSLYCSVRSEMMRMSKSIEQQIDAILQEYMTTERDKIRQTTKEAAQATAADLKKTSPRSKQTGKHFASGWSVKDDTRIGYGRINATVYNRTKPQLTHLVARPHDIRNQYGRYGRTSGDPFLDAAERTGIALYLELLEREL